MAREKVTELPDEVIKALQQDIKNISHGTVVIKIADCEVVDTEVTRKRKWNKKTV